MKNRSTVAVLLFAFFAIAFVSVEAQTDLPLKRTAFKTDTLDFGPGGTLSVVGAPNGSIRIEGWSNNEVQVNAQIEMSARTEAELDQISKVTGFILEESMGRTGIVSIGTHDKTYLKKTIKKFPKELVGLPFRIDYVIKVPKYCDLQIDGGKGDLFIAGVDGTIKINFLDSNAKLDLVGGAVHATFGEGTVEVTVPSRSWRGRFADISLASGTMNVNLPPSLNAEIDASILRNGKIENNYAEMKPKSRRETFTEKLIAAKSGSGGVPLKFTVGDGNLNISEIVKQ